MIDVLEAKKVDSVMLKRNGVKNNITLKNKENIKVKNKNYIIASVPFVVACYIARSDFFLSICDEIIRCRDFGKLLKKPCLKIVSMECQHQNGWDGKEYLQLKKYPKNENTWEKFS